MGISATTALAAEFIDDDKRKNNPAAGGAPALAPGPRTFIEHLKKFAKDIFCSDETVDLHRFQIVVWTLLLGAVFVQSVYVDLAMPDFNATLLTLMGISSGTYIGFKFREQP